MQAAVALYRYRAMPKIVILSYADISSNQCLRADNQDMTGKRALASLSIVFLLTLAAAPVAHAQGVPDTGAVTEAANGATDAVTDTTNEATDTATETVDETTDTVDNATGGATEGVTDTVDDAAGSAGETAGNTAGNAGNTVTNATGGGGNDNGGGGSGGVSLTDQVTNTVKDVTGQNGGGGGGSTSEVINGLLGGGSTNGNGTPDLRGLTPDLVDDLVDEASNFGLSPVAAEGWIEGKAVYGADAYKDPALVLASLTGLLEDFASDFAAKSSTADGELQFSTNGAGNSLFAGAGRVAVAAAKALAFPLALAIGVLGFLMIQGRIGRKDPKLALAPVDTTEESLIFE